MQRARAVAVVCGLLLIVGCAEVMRMSEREKPPGARLYVAPDGNDAWSGRLPAPNAGKTDGPFATLERARDEIRKMKKGGRLPDGGVLVCVAPGDYERRTTFELSAEDSGTEQSPIQYCGQNARLLGGKVVKDFKPVTDPAVLARLDESARGKVVQADLRALSVSDFGDPKGGGLELFFQDRAMTLARWPNEGFVKMVEVLGKTVRDVRGTKGCVEGIFSYEGDRPKRWAGEKDVWVHGYWFWDWADQRHKVESIDTEKRIIRVAPPYHGYGYRKGQWFYAYNLLCELDAPGEWYLDRDKGLLYFWPPAPLQQGEVMVSVLNTMITLKDVSYVTLRGFTIEGLRSTVIAVNGGTRCRIVGCTIKNSGKNAVSISGGAEHGVVGCDVYHMGEGGISLSGGDRKTLTPCKHYAVNNHVHHYGRWKPMYSAGISLHGVGVRAANNLIHNAPHQAMAFGGNDHVIEFNEIHSVCYESNDAGAIYSGRDWTMRGTVIRHNYMHHICGFEGRGCVGVYLDDMYCGTTIYGNVFYRVPMAAFVGGGRDCIIENNLFVDCRPAVHVDARALGWAHACADNWIKEGREKGTLSGIRYKEPPYSTKYPELVNILDDEPAAPKGNKIIRNICWGGKWDHFEGKAKPYLFLQDNLIGEDPHFLMDPLSQTPDFSEKPGFLAILDLQQDSPAYKLGFKRIPIEKIGLFKDETRASWPVIHAIRPMVEPPQRRVVRTGPAPTFRVPRIASSPNIDGVITPAEWHGADATKAVAIERGIYHEPLQPKSYAWLAWDDENLYVAILNEVDPKKPLRMGAKWGQDDAVEVALRNPAAGKEAPIYVLRGYPNGKFESSDEAGAPAALVQKAGNAIRFAARVMDVGRWSAEYRIPFAALNIDPHRHSRFEFNISVRKSAGPIWLMWQGTGACTWQVENAGIIELIP